MRARARFGLRVTDDTESHFYRPLFTCMDIANKLSWKLSAELTDSEEMSNNISEIRLTITDDELITT